MAKNARGPLRGPRVSPIVMSQCQHLGTNQSSEMLRQDSFFCCFSLVARSSSERGKNLGHSDLDLVTRIKVQN